VGKTKSRSTPKTLPDNSVFPGKSPKVGKTKRAAKGGSGPHLFFGGAASLSEGAAWHDGGWGGKPRRRAACRPWYAKMGVVSKEGG
jgi:hypothetical protein